MARDNPMMAICKRCGHDLESHSSPYRIIRRNNYAHGIPCDDIVAAAREVTDISERCYGCVPLWGIISTHSVDECARFIWTDADMVFEVLVQ